MEQLRASLSALAGRKGASQDVRRRLLPSVVQAYGAAVGAVQGAGASRHASVEAPVKASCSRPAADVRGCGAGPAARSLALAVRQSRRASRVPPCARRAASLDPLDRQRLPALGHAACLVFLPQAFIAAYLEASQALDMHAGDRLLVAEHYQELILPVGNLACRCLMCARLTTSFAPRWPCSCRRCCAGRRAPPQPAPRTSSPSAAPAACPCGSGRRRYGTPAAWPPCTPQTRGPAAPAAK